MSRHQPVSPFERASFHRRGSAGWDLSGIQAVAPVVAQPNFQPLVAQLASPQSSYSEVPRAAGVAQGFYVGAQFALVTRDAGSGVSRVLMLESGGGRPKLVGWISVLGRRAPVFQTGRGGDILYVVGEKGEEGIQVFDIPFTAPVTPV